MNNKYTIIKQESIEELNGTGYILSMIRREPEWL